MKEVAALEPIEHVDLPIRAAERPGVCDSEARGCSDDVQSTVVRCDGDAGRRVELFASGFRTLHPPVLQSAHVSIANRTPLRSSTATGPSQSAASQSHSFATPLVPTLRGPMLGWRPEWQERPGDAVRPFRGVSTGTDESEALALSICEEGPRWATADVWVGAPARVHSVRSFVR